MNIEFFFYHFKHNVEWVEGRNAALEWVEGRNAAIVSGKDVEVEKEEL